MQSSAVTRRLQTAKVELGMLLAASISCVAMLTIGVAATKDRVAAAPQASHLFVAALIIGGISLSFALLGYSLYATRKKLRTSLADAKTLRLNLATAESLVKAEPQTLIYWEHGHGLRVVAQTLTGVPGLPADQTELLRFGVWLDASSARNLKAALDALFGNGRAFNMILKTAAGGHLEADGRAAGGRAILRLRDVAGYKRDVSAIIDKHNGLSRDVRSGRALLNALPNPVWLRDSDGRLAWVNVAYSKAVEAKDPTEVVMGQIELLDSRHRKAVDNALRSNPNYKNRLPLISGGVMKSHEVIALNLGDAVAGAAIDVADLETAQGELERQIAAYDRTLDRVATAVAVFNKDQLLTFYNQAYVRLWEHDDAWLRTQPSDRAILDRLREQERLPVVGHFRDWQQKVLSTYQTGAGQEDWWHLPDGRMLHVVAEQRPDGGVTYLYNDETEKIDLESRVKSLSGVQSETLNTLKEGVAVFATDGRLQLYNPAFASIWKLSPRRLSEGPHIDEFTRDAQILYDNPSVWQQFKEAVTSFTDEREPFEGQMVRPDDSVIDYAVAPLPDGASLT
jgi:PAS domain-containing protein